MGVEVAPLIGALATLLFALNFSYVRWESTREGRNIMLTATSVVFVGLGDGLMIAPLYVFGWMGVTVAMISRTVLFYRAQAVQRELLKLLAPDENSHER